MKTIKLKVLGCGMLLLFTCVSIRSVRAQSTEIQQLLLNVEKLSQFKNILSDMKKGYTVLTTGYNAVKGIAQGNFSLHETFMDGLMLVSPEVRKYRRVADIIACQSAIVSEYRTAFARFKASDNFNLSEVDYLGRVYGQLFSQSADNLDELLMVITSGELRMSDDERLQAIDRIYADTSDKLNFLRSFNRQTSILNLQRQKEKADIKGMSNYFNIK